MITNKSSFFLTGFLVSILLSACGVQAPQGTGVALSTRTPLAGGSWGEIRWNQQQPIEIKLHSALPSYHVNEIREAVELWNQHLPQPLLQIKQDEQGNFAMENNYFASGDGVNGFYWVCQSWNYGEEGKQGITQAVTQPRLKCPKCEQIVEADILINCDYFKEENNYEKARVDFKSLLVHEIGHFLGLAHDEHNKESIMYPVLLDQVVRLEFDSALLGQITKLYPAN